MQWYYSKNGTQLGPVAESELRAKLAAGEISQADMVWRDGMSNWLPVAQIPELSTPVESPLRVPYQVPALPQEAHAPGIIIPNYLWQSIVVTIFCCPPFGVPAIIYAAKVDSLRAAGDVQGAISASGTAKMWCLVALGIWGVLFILWLLAAFGTAAIVSN